MQVAYTRLRLRELALLLCNQDMYKICIELPCSLRQQIKHSATGTQTRVARVRAEYPNQLDYSGF